MSDDRVTRRRFVGAGAAAALAATAEAAAPKAPAEVRPSHAPATAAAKTPATKAAEMHYGILGGAKISRLILGANPMGGGAHSRDLLYMSKLMRAYNTEERLLDLLKIAESEGVNAVLHGNVGLIRKHNAACGGRMQTVRALSLPFNGDTDAEKIARSIEALRQQGAVAQYVFGDSGDYLVRNRRVDVLGMALDVAAKMGVALGVGCHALEVVTECARQGLKPAFYVKTFHDDNYWSATPKANRQPFCWYDTAGGNSYSGCTGDHSGFHDNIWCLEPEETTRVMRELATPWIAFKVLAAGAIHPRQGFDFAFRNGADFIAVGMFDYQVRENAQIARDCVARSQNRARPWHA